LLAWLCLSFWHAVKPLPPGVHVSAVPHRVPEGDLELLSDRKLPHAVLARELSIIESAEQLIVIDESPLPRELAQVLLLRRHARPNLKVLVVTDPKPQAYGGTPAQDRSALERVGMTVAPVRLERLRDSSTLYSGLWRLGFAWWSDPYQEAAHPQGLAAAARAANLKSDQRSLLVADDGAGGWISVFGSADGALGLALRGAPARDVLDSELKIAAWSGEDRLPLLPRATTPQPGTVDTRFLSEGAIGSALDDAVNSSTRGDAIEVAAERLTQLGLWRALSAAQARGVAVRVLLSQLGAKEVAAGELARDGVALRFSPAPVPRQLFIVRRPHELIAVLGAAAFTRRNLNDFNLNSAVEARCPPLGAFAAALEGEFSAEWRNAQVPQPPPRSRLDFWRYRLNEFSGLSLGQD
jgi:hypothetical protein